MSVLVYVLSLPALILAYLLLQKVEERGRQWLLGIPVGLFVLCTGTAQALFGAGDTVTFLSGVVGAGCGAALGLWIDADQERRLR